ncbi:PstC family ABC transporter permease [Desulfoluna spongiiphila]|uniref:PstC family ABC transporter permease n=1 Tax=Desulfoluna spongiiphila TaxID=419481 RepID=UPI0012582F6D|nr:ABC transporter permease subunit [Desulfoluna spongiiphila]VVS92056.1 abc transporter type 1 transmembrane domain meti-like [Desulfoluna spongiiphila]
MLVTPKRCHEWIGEGAAAWAAFITMGLTLAIFGFMGWLALPLLEQGTFATLLTPVWQPGQGRFGLLPMIGGTLAVALPATLLAFPVSLGFACFATHLAPVRLRKGLKALASLMTGIPTVVYGFSAVFLLVPLVRQLGGRGSGFSIVAAVLVLALLISPTMILILISAFEAVPRQWLRSFAAMGATPEETVWGLLLPQSTRAMAGALLLGLGRATGDTLIALMLAGNAVLAPGDPLGPARTLTSHIALVMAADFDSPEFRSVFACGILLYLLIFALTLLVRRLTRRPEA